MMDSTMMDSTMPPMQEGEQVQWGPAHGSMEGEAKVLKKGGEGKGEHGEEEEEHVPGTFTGKHMKGDEEEMGPAHGDDELECGPMGCGEKGEEHECGPMGCGDEGLSGKKVLKKGGEGKEEHGEEEEDHVPGTFTGKHMKADEKEMGPAHGDDELECGPMGCGDDKPMMGPMEE